MKIRSLTMVMALALAGCGGGGGSSEQTASTAAKPDAAPAGEEPVLNFYNWSDYIAPDTLDNFEKETGIKVTYDEMDSNDTLESKILAGDTGYDIVVPSSSFLGRQIQAGAYQKLDKSKLTNWSNLDEGLMSKLQDVDPGNEYSFPYLWGTTGIGYNVDKIKEIFGSEDVVNSWDLVFKPENLAKLKDCGVTFLDAPSEIIPTTLYFLKEDPNSFDPAVIDKAAALLETLRPSITNFHSSEYIDALASGNACLVVGWSGDIIQAKARAAEAGGGVNVGYSIPAEGAAIWFDMVAIPKTAKHPENAHKFLNFLLRPDVIAGVSNYVSYPNANKAATPSLDKSITEDPMITPTSDTIQNKLYGLAVLSPEAMKKYNDVWTELKAVD
ncbi:spermidine/putrescine ABC transporter substrate-binding protein PotF [Ahniella affigens]|uniref:Putrescine-binding periplasmic protein n=1 Tax=Ahniella affigens TaxID=2021234 RepID=A0A2P1PNP3_9GAMM|nr:polyamine ABC transporter substrate-binding protein [Ahniella affigens]AVP96460.1 spermidine/putrescine ABC transporter substrate-binding protein PotF [Ahniella affigens]